LKTSSDCCAERREGKTHKAIAKEHDVDERTTQRWIAAYIKKGIE